MLDQYIYISRAKLSTYVPQILEGTLLGKEGKKIAAEVGFDIKVIKGKVSVQEQPIEGLIPMVKLVEKYVINNEELGDIDSGSRWITGELGVKGIRIGENKDIFALIGQYHKCIVLFVGSQVHTQFTAPTQSINAGYSHFHIIEGEILNHWVDAFEKKHEDEFKLYMTLCGGTPGNVNGVELSDFDLAANIEGLYRRADRSTFRVRILARRLFFGRSTWREAQNCAMYSPLYVIQD